MKQHITLYNIIYLFISFILDLDVRCCRKIDSSGFIQLKKLSKLQRLVLYRTMIDVHSIIGIIPVRINSCSSILIACVDCSIFYVLWLWFPFMSGILILYH